MEALAGLSLLVWIAMLGVPISMALLAWCAYYRVKGIESALWAVVTQLQHLRAEKASDDPVQRALRQRESPSDDGKIPLSMFGR